MSIKYTSKNIFKQSLTLKLTVGLSLSTILICFTILNYVSIENEKVKLNILKELHVTIACENAAIIYDELNKEIHNTNLQNEISSHQQLLKIEEKALKKEFYERIFFDNPDYASIFETSHTSKKRKKDRGGGKTEHINSYYLISNEFRVLAHTQSEFVGQKYYDISYNSEKLDLIKNLFKTWNNKITEFEHYSVDARDVIYTILVPVDYLEANMIFVTNIPLSQLKSDLRSDQMSLFNHYKYFSIIFLIVVAFIFSIIVVRPLKKTSQLIEQLVNNSDFYEYAVKNPKEIEKNRMATIVFKIVEKFRKAILFIQNLTEDDLTIEAQALSSTDTLTKSVVKMRHSLIHAKHEEAKRRTEQQQKNWHTEGLNIFSVLFRHNNDDLYKLTNSLISKLVEYIDVQSGAIYLSENEGAQTVLKLYAPCGLPINRLKDNIIPVNQEPVGVCFVEKETIYIDDITTDFTTISSGLGESKPASILITPLIVSDNVIGVMELESLQAIENHKIAFVETIRVSIASAILNSQINQQTADLLQESELQFRELAISEEELRNNITDMAMEQELASQQETRQLSIMNSIIETVLYAEYTISGIVTKVNEQFLQFFKLSQEQTIGKKIGTFEHRNMEIRNDNLDFWDELKKGNIIEHEKYYKSLNEEHWLKEIYTPIIDQYGYPEKVIFMASNISETKQRELKIADLKYKIDLIHQKKLRKEAGITEEKRIPLEDIFNNPNDNFKFIKLEHLTSQYEIEPETVRNNIIAYKDQIPKQINQLKKLTENANWETLSSRATNLHIKVTYLGINEIAVILDYITTIIQNDNPESEVDISITKIRKIWDEAFNELSCINLT